MSLALIFEQLRLKGGNSHDWSGILGHLGSSRVALCIFTHPLLLLFKLILLDLILWERNAWLAWTHFILVRKKSIQWQLLGPLTFEPIAGQSIGHWMLGLEPWDPGRVHYSGKPCGHLPIRASPAFLLLRLLPTSSHLSLLFSHRFIHPKDTGIGCFNPINILSRNININNNINIDIDSNIQYKNRQNLW